jgi:hypothetical protein
MRQVLYIACENEQVDHQSERKPRNTQARSSNINKEGDGDTSSPRRKGGRGRGDVVGHVEG